MRVLTAALGRDVGDGAFQNLQERLLDAFAGNITGDGRIFIFAPDLIDLVNVNDASLSAADISVGSLQQLEDNIFDVFANVTGFGQRGGIDNGERHIEHAG